MRISVEHVTRYRYGDEASYAVQSLRLTPGSYDGHKVLDWAVESRPAGQMLASRDGFGNAVHLLTIDTPHREIEIVARGHVDVEDRHGIVRGGLEPVPLRVFLRRTELTTATPEVEAVAKAVPAAEAITWLHGLMDEIRRRVDYRTGITTSETTAAEALAHGVGVCQDHAHIFVAAARACGFPARYVTGYLLTTGEHTEAAHHAWAEAHVDALGWVGFDVANAICPTDRYVRIASGLDARYAAPVRGTRRGTASETLEVEVKVERRGDQQ
ncbi:MAG TPA: transglutaminase family protein [Hyphomicrobiaceae bacterium]|nr:transglutaminase family protein [Hyphomicrobiaceae bacterium]